MALGIAVVVVGAIAVSDPVVEWWYLRQVRSGSPEAKEAAARKLGALGSVRAIPALLEMAGRDLVKKGDAVGAFGNLTGLPIGLIAVDLDGDGDADLVPANGNVTVRLSSRLRVASGEGSPPLLQIVAKRRVEALRALRTALVHPRPEVRCAAAVTLARVEPAGEVVEILLDARRTESTTSVRRVLDAVLGELRNVHEDVDILWPNSLMAPPRAPSAIWQEIDSDNIREGIDILWPNPLFEPPRTPSAVSPDY